MNTFRLLFTFIFDTAGSSSEDLHYRKHHFLLFFFLDILDMFFLWFDVFGPFHWDKLILLFTIFYDTFNIWDFFLFFLRQVLWRHIIFLFIFDFFGMIVLNILFDLDSISNWNVLPFIDLRCLNRLKLLNCPDILLPESIFDIIYFKLCEYFM